ncbi:MAG: FtsH protease activity modulator HflK [Neisseriaceae bacterium]|nr:FtsH protease activity modulator HflK [Neisseriaceae bacterium]
MVKFPKLTFLAKQELSDFDRIIQSISDALRSMFGGGSTNQNRNGSGNDSNHGGALRWIALVGGVLWLGSGVYTVQAAEQGVVTRFGKFQALTGPGLQWHLPAPIEKVILVNREKIRSISIGENDEESLMVTEDQNIIKVKLAVQYTIHNAPDLLFNNQSVAFDGSADIVKAASEAAIREIVGRNELNFVLNEGRSAVAAEVKKVIQTTLDSYKLGVSIASVNIQNVQPPERVQAAFDDTVKAGQDKEKSRNQGLAYKNDITPKANGLAARLVAEAEGYRDSVVTKAQGDASRFEAIVSEYAAAPKAMRDRLYLDTMQEVMSNSTKVLVDQKAGGNLLYLPFDKLLEAVQSDKAAPTQGSSAPKEVTEKAETEAPAPKASSDPRPARP